MADLTPIEEKMAEVLGLAQAAQQATKKVAQLAEDDAGLRSQLERMHDEAAETEARALDVADRREGKKTAIQEKARETKQEAVEMMRTYLDGASDALDGFEFLVMAEAGELGHVEIVREMSEQLGDDGARELAEYALPIQQRHVEQVREASLALARKEARGD